MKIKYKISLLLVLILNILPGQANSSATAQSWKSNPHIALLKTYASIGKGLSGLFSSVRSNNFDSFYDFERYYHQMADIKDKIYEASDLIDATEDMFEELDRLKSNCDVQLNSEDQRAIAIIRTEVNRMNHLLDNTSDYLSEASARTYTAYKQKNKSYARKVTSEIINYLNRCKDIHFDNYDRLRLSSVENAFKLNISDYIIEQQKNCNK